MQDGAPAGRLAEELALAEDDRIEAADLRLPTNAPSPAAAPPPLVPAAVMPNRDPMVRDPRTADPRDSMSSALPSYIEEIERNAIQQALEDNRYNKTKAAAALGITFRALRYKLKKLGID